MEGDGGNGWEKLLEAQSEYIANLQRMLQSACHNPAPQAGDGTGNAADSSAVAALGQRDKPLDGAIGGGATPSTPAMTAAQQTLQALARQPPPQQPLPADEGAGSYALERAVAAEATSDFHSVNIPQPTTMVNCPAAVAAGPQSAILPSGTARASAIITGPPSPPVPQFAGGGPGAGAGGSATSVVAAAGYPTVAAPLTAAGANQYVATSTASSAFVAPVSADAIASNVSELNTGGTGAAANLAARYEETANEVLRLRLQKSQHEELRAQLERTQRQLRRLSPHAVFQLRSFLERHFRDQSHAAQVQDTLIRLLESLCAVCRIDVGPCTPTNLLNATRKLFRDPHSFASKLCNLPHATSEEAKGLAPFLLPSAQFKRVREKEVNDCYEAFHAWLSAFYLYSVVSDQVAPTAQALERQEWLLRRLSGQAEGSEPPRSSVGVTGGAIAPSSSLSSVSLSTGSAAPARTANIAAAANAGSRLSKTAGSGRSGLGASPLARGRATAQAVPMPQRSSPGHTRPRTSVATDGTDGLNPQSRSPSPGTTRAPGGVLRQRQGVIPAAFGSSSGARPAPPLRNSLPSVASATLGAVARRESQGQGHVVSTVAPPAVVATVTGGVEGAGKTPTGSPGLTRVQSEKTIGITRSPRTGKRDSRSPSPGTGRASPAAPPPRALHALGASRSIEKQRKEDTVLHRRALSPSQSEGTLPGAQRMVSAPTSYGHNSRTVDVRTKAAVTISVTGASGDRGRNTGANSGRLSVASTSARSTAAAGNRGVVARPMSPDKCGGPPISGDTGLVDATPRSSAENSGRGDRQSPDESGSEDDDDDDGYGPRRRRLSAKQYEALVRCAQQVVASGSVPPMVPPHGVVQLSSYAPQPLHPRYQHQASASGPAMASTGASLSTGAGA